MTEEHAAPALTEEQIDRVLKIVPQAVQQLRTLSPVAAGTLS